MATSAWPHLPMSCRSASIAARTGLPEAVMEAANAALGHAIRALNR